MLKLQIPKSGLDCKSIPYSTFSKRIVQTRNRLDQHNELGGLSILKTWGLASLNGFVAACVTIHPGDMAEYSMPSQQRSTIVFSTDVRNGSDSKDELFPWYSMIEPRSVHEVQKAIVASILESEYQDNQLLDEFDIKILYAATMVYMLLLDDILPKDLLKTVAAFRHLEQAAKVDLSSEIECAQGISTGDLNINTAKAQMREVTASRSTALDSVKAARGLLDLCPFCGRTIFWESLTEASCFSGHRFSELSFALIRPKGF